MSRQGAAPLCPRCGGIAEQQPVFRLEFAYRYVDADGFAMTEPATYHGFACEGCTDLSIYIHSNLHSPASNYGELVYPRARETGELPQAVALAYGELQKVRHVSRLAFFLLGRRVLEEIAKNQGCTVGNLAAALNQLSTDGKLPTFLSEASNMIRIFGNAAAHDSTLEFNEHHIDMVDQFLDLLIDHLYLAPASLQIYKHLLESSEPDV